MAIRRRNTFGDEKSFSPRSFEAEGLPMLHSRMDDLDIYRAANVLLKRYDGDNVVLFCVRQADVMLGVYSSRQRLES